MHYPNIICQVQYCCVIHTEKANYKILFKGGDYEITIVMIK